ncbi:HTH-type transcriptional repressor NemR [Anaerolineales bacterium]|nr:HTH-type transcriptional repressor NemR [Anaerolineales bacterium]
MTSSETYDKILQTARRLFVQQGYTATSMRQVAEQAEIGKATIYHHFPDKQAIVMALLQKSTDRMDEVLEVIRAEGDPRQRIRVAVTASIAFLLESADILQIVRREVPSGRDQMQSKFVRFFQEYIVLLTDAIQRGMEQGTFRSVDPANAARVLLTTVQGTFAMAYLVGERPQSPEESAAKLLEIYFQGIDAR